MNADAVLQLFSAKPGVGQQVRGLDTDNGFFSLLNKE